MIVLGCIQLFTRIEPLNHFIPCNLKKKLTFLLLNSRFVKSFWPTCNSVKLILKGHADLLPDNGNVEADDEGGEDVDDDKGDDVEQGAAVEEEGGGERGVQEAGGEDCQELQR